MFEQHFSLIIFASSSNIPENLREMCCVLSKLDHFACDILFFNDGSHFTIYRDTRIILHAKWSNLQNTEKITKFSEMLGEDKKMTQE